MLAVILWARWPRLGITLARLPDEYRVNFYNGTDATHRTVETLDQALVFART
jgi:hypothetical protein